LGVLLTVLGLIVCTYGYMKLGEGTDIIPDNEYVKVDVGSIAQILAVVAGVLSMLTGILGILTSRCYNKGFNCIFSTPYIIMALVSGILLLSVAGVASGGANSQIEE
jgi:hypothetical protein